MEEEGGPPAKRPHLEDKQGMTMTAAVRNSTVIPEPLEDYTKIGTLPPPTTKTAKVSNQITDQTSVIFPTC